MNDYDKNYLVKYASENYSKFLDFNEEDFKKDFTRFFITRKMIRRFLLKGVVNHGLLLNNIIVCLNVFGIEKTNVILRAICTDNEFGCAKSCLLFLNSYKQHNDDIPENRIIHDIIVDFKQRYNLT